MLTHTCAAERATSAYSRLKYTSYETPHICVTQTSKSLFRIDHTLHCCGLQCKCLVLLPPLPLSCGIIPASSAISKLFSTPAPCSIGPPPITILNNSLQFVVVIIASIVVVLAFGVNSGHDFFRADLLSQIKLPSRKRSIWKHKFFGWLLFCHQYISLHSNIRKSTRNTKVISKKSAKILNHLFTQIFNKFILAQVCVGWYALNLKWYVCYWLNALLLVCSNSFWISTQSNTKTVAPICHLIINEIQGNLRQLTECRQVIQQTDKHNRQTTSSIKVPREMWQACVVTHGRPDEHRVSNNPLDVKIYILIILVVEYCSNCSVLDIFGFFCNTN